MATRQSDGARGKVAQRAVLLRLTKQKGHSKQHGGEANWKARHNRTDLHTGEIEANQPGQTHRQDADIHARHPTHDDGDAETAERNQSNVHSVTMYLAS